MRKRTTLILTMLSVLALSSCGRGNAVNTENNTSGTAPVAEITAESSLKAVSTEDNAKTGFCIGIARRDITPPLGSNLAGYSPAPKAKAVHDALHIIVLAIEQNGTTVLMAVEDTSNVGNAGDDLRKAMSEATGVPFENTSISATHTHSGPVTYTKPPYSYPNPEYVYGTLIPLAAEAAKEAVEGLAPAEMGIGTIHSEVAINRRQITKDGKITHGQEPLGLFDPTMTVISFRDPVDKHCIANVVHYGCHNTASGKITTITRDWCGVMKDRLETLSGGVTAFINGCVGDCGPRLPNGKTTGTLEMAVELGEKAAEDACAAWRGIKEWQSDVDLKVLPGTVEIPYENPSAHGGDACLKLPTTVWSLGSLAFVPSTFETFAETTMRIKRHSPFAHTLVVSQSNFRGGYLPTRSQFPLGGYEVDSYKTAVYGFFLDQDEGFVQSCIKLLEELGSQ